MEDKKWIIDKKIKSLKLKNPLLLVGLPGIGNVGKISVDFLIDELKAKEIYQIKSQYFPHSVFITDDSIIELPSVSFHYVKAGKKVDRDILLLSGDVQPMEEQSSYIFCDKMLDLASEFNCKEIITIGGIGLSGEQKKPKVYGVTTDEATQKIWKKASKHIHFRDNKAATIVGATGLLLGLGKHRHMTGISLLCETIGHPYHIGLKEASSILDILSKVLKLKVNLKRLDKEIRKEELARDEKTKETHENGLMKKLKRFSGESGDTSYIG
jgi:uncharacterized protein